MVKRPEGRGDEDKFQSQRGPGGAENAAQKGVHLEAPRNEPEAEGGVDEVQKAQNLRPHGQGQITPLRSQ